MHTVIVTGASSGIGAAVAERLAEPGRRLLLQGRRRDALRRVARRVEARGAAAAVVVADLSVAREIDVVLAAAGEGEVAALVNNAGSALVKPVGEIGLDEWQASVALNLTAPFLLVRGLLPRLRAGSTIVNILSVAARQGFSGWTAYCAAKAGLDGFARALREELRERGIRVVNIYPAATDTPLWSRVPGSWERSRMLRPADVAGAVAFALGQPARVEVGEISMGDLSGRL